MSILTSIGAAFLKIKGAVMATTASKVVTAIVTTTVLVGGTIGVTQTDVLASPEKKVERAMESLFENEESAISELFGWEEFVKAIEKKGLETGFGFRLENVPLDDLGLSGVSVPNIGVDFVCRYDAKGEKMSLNAGAKVADTTLLSAHLYADEEKMFASVPELWKGYLGANYADTEFSDKLKNSELSAMLGEEAVSVIETLTEKKPEKADAEDVKRILGYLADAKKNIDALWESMEAEKGEDTQLLVDGETIKCKVYVASFDREDVCRFLEVLAEQITEVATAELQEPLKQYEETDPELYAELMAQFEEERAIFLAEIEAIEEQLRTEEVSIGLTVYLKGKRLLKAEFDYSLEHSATRVTAQFAKDGNRYDNMILTVDKTLAGETAQVFVLSHKTEHTEEMLSSVWSMSEYGTEQGVYRFTYEKLAGDFYLGLLLPGEEFAFEVEGVLTIPERGMELAFELNDISLTEYGEKLSLGLQTDLSLKVLEEELTAPEEVKWDVVSMSAKDWEDLTAQINGNLYSLVLRLLFSQ